MNCNIILDAGNTRIKTFLVNADVITPGDIYSYAEIEELYKYISKLNPTTIIISDVRGEISEEITLKTSSQVFICDVSKKLPLTIDYKTPKTLGFDRIAVAIGAEQIMPNTNKLIIDFGTAITIDFVDKNSTYKGGNISPGLQTRFNSLHHETGKLPLLSKEGEISLTGTSTEEAIRNGVIQGIAFEIQQYIEEYSTIFSDLNVFYCGGDAFFFEKMAKKSIFAEPNLLAKGIHTIYTYNVKN